MTFACETCMFALDSWALRDHFDSRTPDVTSFISLYFKKLLLLLLGGFSLSRRSKFIVCLGLGCFSRHLCRRFFFYARQFVEQYLL
mmetsp:Transcript_935/g.1331  ORF Transcript_935/g.1331 Transcript_935/m.1331 type:complete len:86 (-) Transcript_935:132-389(-)